MSTRRSNKLTAEELNALVDPEPETSGSGVPVRRVAFSELEPAIGRTFEEDQRPTLNFLLDVPLEVQVVLGKTRMTVRQVLEMGPGSVVELDKAYAEPVDVYLNGRLAARGEVVVAGENFGVKITEIFSEAVKQA